MIHDYFYGWKDGAIYGNVTEGFFDWVIAVKDHFQIEIYSTRSETPAGIRTMKAWLFHQLALYPLHAQHIKEEDILFALFKPKATVVIDDRAIRFEGNWSAPEFTVEALKAFKPWNKQD